MRTRPKRTRPRPNYLGTLRLRGSRAQRLELPEHLRGEGSVDPLLSEGRSLVDLVEAVRALPYGRPTDRTVAGMLRERRGTCSTKHRFLAEALAQRFPTSAPR